MKVLFDSLSVALRLDASSLCVSVSESAFD